MVIIFYSFVFSPNSNCLVEENEKYTYIIESNLLTNNVYNEMNVLTKNKNCRCLWSVKFPDEITDVMEARVDVTI